jgi:hypothetical protein
MILRTRFKYKPISNESGAALLELTIILGLLLTTILGITEISYQIERNQTLTSVTRNVASKIKRECRFYNPYPEDRKLCLQKSCSSNFPGYVYNPPDWESERDSCIERTIQEGMVLGSQSIPDFITKGTIIVGIWTDPTPLSESGTSDGSTPMRQSLHISNTALNPELLTGYEEGLGLNNTTEDDFDFMFDTQASLVTVETFYKSKAISPLGVLLGNTLGDYELYDTAVF